MLLIGIAVDSLSITSHSTMYCNDSLSIDFCSAMIPIYSFAMLMVVALVDGDGGEKGATFVYRPLIPYL